MRTDSLVTIVTQLDRAVIPFVVSYYDADQTVNVRLLVFAISITEVMNIVENFLADLAIDGVIVSIELFGVHATLYGIKPSVAACNTTDELDDPIRQ